MAHRSDGRTYDTFRTLTIEYEGLDRSDGSARFGFGDTKALASVSGPIEVRLAAEQASCATLEVNVRPLANLPGTESKALASTIRTLLLPSILLTQNPRTLIQLVLQSLSPTSSSRFHPSLAAAMINASTLALMNTGSVSMRGIVCSVSVGRLLSATGATNAFAKPILVLDPSPDEEVSLGGGGCFAFLFTAGIGTASTSPEIPSSDAVWSNWHSTSPFDEDEVSRARELARAGAQRVWMAIKESVSWMGLPPDMRSQKLPTPVTNDEDTDIMI